MTFVVLLLVLLADRVDGLLDIGLLSIDGESEVLGVLGNRRPYIFEFIDDGVQPPDKVLKPRMLLLRQRRDVLDYFIGILGFLNCVVRVNIHKELHSITLELS